MTTAPGANPAIIEVGLNESATRDQNPHVPYSPQECAADAVRCGEAGATVVHWHARDASGTPLLGDPSLHLEMLEHLEEGSPIVYPTYPPQRDLDQRLDHCWELGDHGLELVPVDLGSTNICLWDEASGQLVGVDEVGGGVVANPTNWVRSMIRRSRGLGLAVTLGSFDVGHTRSVGLLCREGVLTEPVYLKIFLSEVWPTGPIPSTEAIDFHLAQLPQELDVRWVVVPYLTTDAALVERLCRHALERGGGIRVGVGDTPEAFDGLSNPQLTAMAAQWAGEAGRAVCTPAALRTVFSIGGRSG